MTNTPKPPQETPISPSDEPKKEEEEKKEGEESGEAEDEEGGEEEEEKKEEKEPLTPPVVATPPRYPESPIKKQERDDRLTQAEEMLEIVFLSGRLRGMKMNLRTADSSFLGTGIKEISHKQSSEWEEGKDGHIRPGSNFKKIGSRTISFQIMFYDRTNDVAHLAEQMAHLTELSEDDDTPAKVHLTQGNLIAAPCICEEISTKYSDPMPGRKGFHAATVDLSFRLLGGKGSPHAFGTPLTSTPLGDIADRLSELERARQGDLAVAELLLGDCLGEQGKAELRSLLEEGGGAISDPDRVLDLDPNTRLQLAIAGVIPNDIRTNEEVLEALNRDLAYAVAQSNPETSSEDRVVAEALIDGDPSRLPSALASEYANLKEHFDILSSDMKGAGFTDQAATFQDTNSGTAQVLNGFGACGLTLRQAGGLSIGGTAKEGEEAEDLADINEAIRTMSSKEIQEAFGLETESQARLIRNGIPYQSKQQFVEFIGQSGSGLNGYAAWGHFMEHRSQAQEEEPVEVP